MVNKYLEAIAHQLGRLVGFAARTLPTVAFYLIAAGAVKLAFAVLTSPTNILHQLTLAEAFFVALAVRILGMLWRGDKFKPMSQNERQWYE